MSSAVKGLTGLVAALALIGGVAFWLLNDSGGSNALPAGNHHEVAGKHDEPLAEPAAAKPQGGAQRSAEETPKAAAGEAAIVASTTPVAEFLGGTVVDADGHPVANAEISFAARTSPVKFGGRRLVMNFGAQKLDDVPAVKGKTGPDGSFRLPRVPRVEGFELSVDHPDYVFLVKDDIVLPSRGLDLGRIVVTPGGAVSGDVFAPGGAKVANAEVWLDDAPDADNNAAFFNFGNAARGHRKTTTDGQGHFRLGGMPAGKCVVVAKSDESPESESAPLEIKVREETANVVVHLEAGDRITGTVHGPDGKPLADAEVHVGEKGSSMRKMMRFGGRNGFEPDAKSDAAGHFEVKALKRGTYEVAVAAKGFAEKVLSDIDSSVGTPLDVTLGAGTHVAGTVRLKDSPELPKNVKVQLTPYFGDDRIPLQAVDFPDADNLATQDGSFLIPDVEPGKYRIVARGDGTSRGMSAPIEVADGQSLENVEIVVERGAVMTGRVLDAATGAPVADAEVQAATIPPPPSNDVAGAPFGKAVRVISASVGGGRRIMMNGSRQVVGHAKSDAEGRFVIQGLAAGSYTLDVRHPEFAVSRSAPVDLLAGEGKDGLDQRLGRGGSIEGSVTGLDGKPRVGDQIDVMSKTIEGVSLHAVTDAEGAYHVEHVPAGDGTVERNEPDADVGGKPVFRADFLGLGNGGNQPDPGKPYSVKEGGTVRIDFTQQERPYVEGVVRSAQGAVAGATVSALPSGDGGMPMIFGDQKRATTGPDGSYRITDLNPGSYRIVVRHPEALVPVRANVEVKAGTPMKQDFFLEGGVIEGDVTALKNHARIEGAQVTVQKVEDGAADNGAQVTTGTFAISIAGVARGRRGGMKTMRFGDDFGETRVLTDAGGHFRVPWVPAGKYKVTVSRDGFLAAESETVEVPANGHVGGLKLELPPAARLIVHVKSKATGMALTNAPVELSSESLGNNFGNTDEEGAARFNSLKPGTWNIAVRKDWQSEERQQKTVDAPVDQTTEITIDV